MFKDIFYSVLFTFLILYAWAGICFFVFRFSCTETESRARNFLNANNKFFADKKKGGAITQETLRKSSLWGWYLLPFACIFLVFNRSYEDFFVTMAILFFAGYLVARGWYGMRCLRLIGLDSYKAEMIKDSKERVINLIALVLYLIGFAVFLFLELRK